MRTHEFFGDYGWFSSRHHKRAHAVYASDDEIERRALCGAGKDDDWAEWNEPGDKPECPKCSRRLKAPKTSSEEESHGMG